MKEAQSYFASLPIKFNVAYSPVRYAFGVGKDDVRARLKLPDQRGSYVLRRCGVDCISEGVPEEKRGLLQY